MNLPLLAGAQREPALAVACRHALDLWGVEVEAVLVRLLDGNPIADAVDAPGLAKAVAGAFVGLELYDGVDPDAAAAAALGTLESLAVLTEVAQDLGPVARRALRARLRRTTPR